jgi:hypothetical protein
MITHKLPPPMPEPWQPVIFSLHLYNFVS